MKKRFAAIMCAVLLISTVIISASASDMTVDVGDLTLKGDNLTEDIDYSYNNRVLTIKSGKAMTISSPRGASNGGATQYDRIEVDADGVEVNLTFENLKINRGGNAVNSSAFKINAAKKVTVTLKEENRLESTDGFAGLQNNSIPLEIKGTGSLYAEGGYRGAGIGGGTGKSGEHITISGSAKVTATGYNGGAGIGGGYNGSGNDINITDIAQVTASGSFTRNEDFGYTGGAGIGGGYNGNAKSITIKDSANVTANGYCGSAGIGGGEGGSGESIYIYSGTVNAMGIGGAGIGGGDGGDGKTIYIYGGTVSAYGGYWGYQYTEEEYKNNVTELRKEPYAFGGGSGIGGGRGGDGSDIEISGGEVIAKGTMGAGIGGGGGTDYDTRDNIYKNGGNGENIRILGGNVTAECESQTKDPAAYYIRYGNSAGIGGGSGGNAKDITITTDGIVNATGGKSGGAGIGGGQGYTISNSDYTTGKTEYVSVGGNADNIKIGGSGTITATAGGTGGGAGIGGGASGYATNIIIGNIEEGSNVTIYATGHNGGAGIGGGQSYSYYDRGEQKYVGGNATGITINGGTINATGGSSGGAGIGGGSGGDGSNITIDSSTIIAESKNGGAGIGGGSNGNGDGITIKGDNTTVTSTSSTGAGIGGGAVSFSGKGGNGSNITIESGTVIAKSTSSGAGIGGGQCGSGSNITIEGGNITATGNSGAGIGGGSKFNPNANGGDGSSITIKGENTIITATSSSGGAGIGGGQYGSGTGIIIQDGENITAKGQYRGSGIGAGSSGEYSEVTITGGNVNAVVEYSSIGIGGGTKQTDIAISGGEVTAESKYGGVAIGNSNTGANTTVTIIAGTVTANDGNTDPGIVGTDVYIGYENYTIKDEDGNIISTFSTTETSYPWVVTNKIDSSNDHSSDYCGVVFDQNHKASYTEDVDGEGNTFPADGVVYGNGNIIQITDEHTLKNGELLRVQGDTTLVTNNKLILEEGSILYLEEGADLITYKDENLQAGSVLHEDPSVYGDDGICEICGSIGTHEWAAPDTDPSTWNYDITHHWHKCLATNDCSVKHIEINLCNLIKVHEKNEGYAEHVFADPIESEDKLIYSCTTCLYSYTVKKTLLYKYGENNVPLGGAEFGIYSNAECTDKIGSGISSDDGKVNFEFDTVINPDTLYCIKETEAPDGYEKSDTVYTVEFTSEIITDGIDGSTSIKETVKYGAVGSADTSEDIPICVNTQITPGTIQIKKAYNENGVNMPLAGAVFGLYSSVDCSEANKIGEATSIMNGTEAIASFTADIELNTTYCIKEISAPAGYAVSEEIFTAAVGADGTVTYNGSSTVPICVNTKIDPDAIQINKVDGETGDPLAGAQFGLYSALDRTDLVAEATTAQDGTAVFTAVEGKTIELGKTYIIKETKAPDGYVLSDDEFAVMVNENGTLTYGGTGGIPVCRNTKIAPGTVQIRNIDGRNNTPLSGAVFTLYIAENDNSLTDTGITAVGSNGAAVFNVTEIPAAFALRNGQEIELGMNYLIKQTAAPAGYELSEELFPVEVDTEGNVTYGGASDVPVCKNYQIDAIKIYKIYMTGETKNPLPGASFALYSEEDGSKTVVASGTSSASGEVLFGTVGGSKIELGKTYCIEETAAPEGYKVYEEIITVVVGETGIVTYDGSPAPFECVNEKLVPEPIDPGPIDPVPVKPPTPVIPDPVVTPDPIQLYKTDGAGNPLTGARFGLYRDALCTDLVTSGTTAMIGGNRAAVSFTDGVELNTPYYIKEISAPEGYYISEEIFMAAAGSDGRVRYGDSYDIPICRNEKAVTPAEPPAPVTPYPPVNPFPPVYPYPPVIVTPIVTEPEEIDPEPIEDDPYYEDVSTEAGIFDDDENIDFTGNGLAAVITLIALTSVGFIVRKRTSKK